MYFILIIYANNKLINFIFIYHYETNYLGKSVNDMTNVTAVYDDASIVVLNNLGNKLTIIR